MPNTLAAVDLGSNSFRLAIARRVGESLQMVDGLRENVRLAEYLDESRRLNAEGRERALDCLHRFGQRVRHLAEGSVRAVGTNTLRKARNAGSFLAEAEEALGRPIEIISGQEEARLIFLGVSHSLSGSDERRLVADIGGGSTELIVGEAFEPLSTESLYMGCVSYTRNFFPDGKISRKRLEAAELAARLELRPVKAALRRLGWQRAIGSSGTFLAVAKILRANGWSAAGITPAGLRRLRKEVLATDHLEKLSIKGLSPRRAQVLPGGLAIVSAIFETFKIETLNASSGALREGVLYDLLGRIRHEDVRDRTIQRFVEQYHVDVEQAARVEKTALAALEQVSGDWDLDLSTARNSLSWGARLHEIGLAVAHSGYHKHGAYLIDHSDMPGFSFQDQRILSLLVRSFRRKFSRSLFEALPRPRAKSAMRLAILLRLAVLLNRSRNPRGTPELRFQAKGKKIRVECPADWLAEHPLTGADLEQEKSYLEAAGFELRLGSD